MNIKKSPKYIIWWKKETNHITLHMLLKRYITIYTDILTCTFKQFHKDEWAINNDFSPEAQRLLILFELFLIYYLHEKILKYISVIANEFSGF